MNLFVYKVEYLTFVLFLFYFKMFAIFIQFHELIFVAVYKQSHSYAFTFSTSIIQGTFRSQETLRN